MSKGWASTMLKFILLALYILLLLYSGYYGMRRSKTVAGFFLGGRTVGPWLSAFAYGTTYFSAVIFVGYAGKVGWGFGLSALWVAIGNTFIGSALAWWVLANPTREMTGRLGAMTMPEFLSARYGSPALKYYAALVIFVFMIPYSASVYMGLSYIFEKVFSIPFNYAAIFMALLTAVYLIAGGYRAVAFADLVQGVLMIFGALILFYFIGGAPEAGGLGAIVGKLRAINPKLASPVGPPGFVPLASLVVLTSLGVWGMPQMVQKFYAIKDRSVVLPGAIVATLFALVITCAAYFTGSLCRLFFDKIPLDAVTGKPSSDLMIPLIMVQRLPAWGVALILLLILSASMSTLSSLVLVSSSAIAIDMLPARLGDKRVAAMRWLCALFILLSVLLALRKPAIILSMMALSWGAVAGAFLAPYIYGLFWRRASAAGVWAASLAGLAISVGWSLSVTPRLDPAKIPMIGSAAMLAPLLVLPVVSLLTPKPRKELAAKAFGDENQ